MDAGHSDRLGLSQEALAAVTGMSVRRISELESGRVSRPRKGPVSVLADAFGLCGVDRERFLRQAYESGDSAPAAASIRPSRHVPRQLPAPPQLFTGQLHGPVLPGSTVETQIGSPSRRITARTLLPKSCVVPEYHRSMVCPLRLIVLTTTVTGR